MSFFLILSPFIHICFLSLQNNMPRYTPRRTENLVLMYYKRPMKYKRLEMILKSKGIFVSDKTIKNIIDGKGKKR